MLQIKNLRKSFGSTTALNGLDFEVEQGQIYGFVGQNGAGKTTTMKIIAGLLQADDGEVLIDGKDIQRDSEYRSKAIGYMPDFFGTYDNLLVMEYMEFFFLAYGNEKKSMKERILKLLELVDLSDKAEDYVDSLSRGMKQRLCIARAMVHQPKLLLLDEPASGMEPRARIKMQEMLKELAEGGTTILISSHVLSELADVCTNIGIIDHGKMLLSGGILDIMQHEWESTREIIMNVLEQQQTALRLLKADERVSNIAIQGDSILVSFVGNKSDEADLLAKLVLEGVKIAQFCHKENNLEEIFLALTK